MIDEDLIRALREEALLEGDGAMLEVCDDALEGDAEALECIRKVIARQEAALDAMVDDSRRAADEGSPS